MPEPEDGLELLLPREVPLGGPRAMLVQRTLPHRHRRAIGAWCFVDSYGPDDVAASGGMVVPPHPHTGLQTVSWLFSGEVLHRDSLGSEQLIRPGQLNLMTAGHGIARRPGGGHIRFTDSDAGRRGRTSRRSASRPDANIARKFARPTTS